MATLFQFLRLSCHTNYTASHVEKVSDSGKVKDRKECQGLSPNFCLPSVMSSVLICMSLPYHNKKIFSCRRSQIGHFKWPYLPYRSKKHCVCIQTGWADFRIKKDFKVSHHCWDDVIRPSARFCVPGHYCKVETKLYIKDPSYTYTFSKSYGCSEAV